MFTTERHPFKEQLDISVARLRFQVALLRGEPRQSSPRCYNLAISKRNLKHSGRIYGFCWIEPGIKEEFWPRTSGLEVWRYLIFENNEQQVHSHSTQDKTTTTAASRVVGLWRVVALWRWRSLNLPSMRLFIKSDSWYQDNLSLVPERYQNQCVFYTRNNTKNWFWYRSTNALWHPSTKLSLYVLYKDY